MSELIGINVKLLIEHPPVQGGSTFDMTNIIQQTLKKRQS